APILAIASALWVALQSGACHATAARTEVQAQPVLVQPGAPGAQSHPITAEKATDLSSVRATEADIRFMQGMIHHHLQAIDMTNLLAQNTQSEDMRKLGLRMSLSQSDEIQMMRNWLEIRGQEAPGDHASHMPGAPMMPGMLSPEEVARLA